MWSQLIFICAFLSLGLSRSLEEQGSVAPPGATNNDAQSGETLLADSLEENAHCIVDADDPFPSNSEGDIQVTCPPGQRKGSEENPCPDRQSCCPCGNRSYQSNYTFCDRCIRHTVCTEYEKRGDADHDSVCRSTAVPTDTVLQGMSSTIETSTSITPATTADSKTSGGSTKLSSTPIDTGQEEKFTIPWPWSIVAVVIIAVIFLLMVLAFVRLIVKRRRKYIRDYTLTQPDDNVQLQVVTSTPGSQENGHIPAQDAGADFIDGANDIAAENQR